MIYVQNSLFFRPDLKQSWDTKDRLLKNKEGGQKDLLGENGKKSGSTAERHRIHIEKCMYSWNI